MILAGTKVVGTIFAAYSEIAARLGGPADGVDTDTGDGSTCVWEIVEDLDGFECRVLIHDREVTRDAPIWHQRDTPMMPYHWTVSTVRDTPSRCANLVEKYTGRPVDLS